MLCYLLSRECWELGKREKHNEFLVEFLELGIASKDERGDPLVFSIDFDDVDLKLSKPHKFSYTISGLYKTATATMNKMILKSEMEQN